MTSTVSTDISLISARKFKGVSKNTKAANSIWGSDAHHPTDFGDSKKIFERAVDVLGIKKG